MEVDERVETYILSYTLFNGRFSDRPFSPLKTSVVLKKSMI